MQLFIHEPNDLSDQNIAMELAASLLAVECGYKAITTRDYEPITEAQSKEKASSFPSEHASLYEAFRAWRDYGFNGKYQPDMPSPHDAYTLLLMAAPVVELFGGSQAYNCAAILQSLIAREKIDTHLGRTCPGFLRAGYFNDLTVGGNYEGLTTYELSLLSRMSIQAVRNDFQKPDAPLTTKTNSGLVTLAPEDACSWLQRRRGFRDTYSSEMVGDSLLVPQARDASFFGPHCKQLNGYKIGKKGEETYVENFTEALDILSRMPKPYWRRPSPTSGVPGIVSGATWIEKTKQELGIA